MTKASIRGTWSGRIALALGTVVLLVAAEARAAPEDLAVAEKLFEQGQRDMAAGNFAVACPRLAESRRLDPQIGVTLYLADCLQRTGKIATAWGLFRDAAQSAAARNDARAAIARKRAEILEPRLSSVTLRVSPTVEVNGLELVQDDAPVARARWNVPAPVDPGEHTVTVQAAGYRTARRNFTIDKDGQRLDVEIPRLEKEAPAPPPPPVVVNAPLAPEPPPARSAGTSTLGYGLLGGSAVSLAVGIVVGLRAASAASDVKALCPAYPACNAVNSGEASRINDSAGTQATLSTVAFGISAAALAVAIVLLLNR